MHNIAHISHTTKKHTVLREGSKVAPTKKKFTSTRRETPQTEIEKLTRYSQLHGIHIGVRFALCAPAPHMCRPVYVCAGMYVCMHGRGWKLDKHSQLSQLPEVCPVQTPQAAL